MKLKSNIYFDRIHHSINCNNQLVNGAFIQHKVPRQCVSRIENRDIMFLNGKVCYFLLFLGIVVVVVVEVFGIFSFSTILRGLDFCK